MNHPNWLQVPWLVFAVAVGLKAWKASRLIHRQISRSTWRMERFRAELERTWHRTESLR